MKKHTVGRFVAIFFVIFVLMVIGISSCASLQGNINELRGDITGNQYTIDTFDNFGKKRMTIRGTRINVEPNIVREYQYNESGWGYSNVLSSAITINIDGSQVTSCGDTMIFYEDGLTPDVNFEEEDINSSASGVEDYTIISGMINKFKNQIGKPVVVFIKSQTGAPIYAFSGEKVHWEIPENLPKFTKLTVDGMQLYIHRANFQIVDKELLEEVV